MTKQEAIREFGLTPKQAYYALDLIDYFPGMTEFVKYFRAKFRVSIHRALEAREFANWAQDPDNIHLFY